MAKEANKKSKKGKTPKELMKKHILDKEDKISEEEFREMQVGIDVDTTGEQQAVDLPDDNERPHDEDKDHAKTTPWDVIK